MPTRSTKERPQDRPPSSPGRKVAAPGFLPPATESPPAGPDYLTPPLGPPGSGPLPGSESVLPPIGAELPEQPRTTDPTGSSPASSTEPVRPIDRRALERAIAQAVRTGGKFANAQLTDPDEHEAGIWLTDDDEDHGIARPVASILARHGGPGIVNPDLSDALSAMIVVAAYLSRQLGRIRELKRARMRAGMPTDHAPAEDEAA